MKMTFLHLERKLLTQKWLEFCVSVKINLNDILKREIDITHFISKKTTLQFRFYYQRFFFVRCSFDAWRVVDVRRTVDDVWRVVDDVRQVIDGWIRLGLTDESVGAFDRRIVQFLLQLLQIDSSLLEKEINWLKMLLITITIRITVFNEIKLSNCWFNSFLLYENLYHPITFEVQFWNLLLMKVKYSILRRRWCLRR